MLAVDTLSFEINRQSATLGKGPIWMCGKAPQGCVCITRGSPGEPALRLAGPEACHELAPSQAPFRSGFLFLLLVQAAALPAHPRVCAHACSV